MGKEGFSPTSLACSRRGNLLGLRVPSSGVWGRREAEPDFGEPAFCSNGLVGMGNSGHHC